MAKATKERIIDYPAGSAGRASGYVAGATSTATTLADHNHRGGLGSGGTLDHGAALTGLGDNDHPQYGLVASPLSQFAATTSAQLAGVLSDETGTGAAVFGTNPTLTTPNISESAAPTTPPTGTAAIWLDSTSGNLMIKFDSGNTAVLATYA